jgi:hypothetical protein
MEYFLVPKIVFAILGLFAMFAYWAFAFFTLYHLTRFGIGTKPKIFSAIFLAGSIGLFCISTALFLNIDMYALNGQLDQLFAIPSLSI